MFLSTSNPYKIKEYEKFGIEAKLGIDIKEVLGTIDEVIIYKILSSKPFTLVEDTVLEVAGQAIVDTKYKISNILENDDACWITSIGYRDNVNIYVYRGYVKGKITTPIIEHYNSFERFFIPAGVDITLYELRKNGLKSNYSARRIAVEAYKKSEPIFIRKITDIPKWEGEYQGE